MSEPTHAELVERAARWLRNSAVVYAGIHWSDGRPRRQNARCGVVLTEHVSSAGEFPDVIGWFGGGRFSVVVEAKSTIADFRGDRRKPSRRYPQMGAGTYRYYLTRPGLVSLDQLPLRWGLLEVYASRVRVRRLADFQECCWRVEVQMLAAEVRRQSTNNRGGQTHQ
jgi:hypothetical protein